MKKTTVMASFNICGDDFNLSEVSQTLNIIPTEVRTKGVIPEGKRRPSIETSWTISTEKEDSDDINDQINQLLVLLQDKQELLLKIKKTFPIKYVLLILIEVEKKKTPAIYFESKTLKFLNYIETQIDIDLYV
jgi:hypothetical protein